MHCIYHRACMLLFALTISATNHAMQPPKKTSLEAFFLKGAKKGDIDMIRHALKYGVNIDAQDANGDTAMHHLARTINGQNSVSLLLATGAKTTIYNNNKKLPIHLISDQMNRSMFKYFARYPDILMGDGNGTTAYEIVCASKDVYMRAIMHLVYGLSLVKDGKISVQEFVQKTFQKQSLSSERINIESALSFAHISYDTGTKNALYNWIIDRCPKDSAPEEYHLFGLLPEHVSLFLWRTEAERIERLLALEKKRSTKQMKTLLERLVLERYDNLGIQERDTVRTMYKKLFKIAHESVAIKTILPLTSEYETLVKLNLENEDAA